MLQPPDNPNSAESAARAAWMSVLARAPLALLEGALGPQAEVAPDWLRPPETGLIMIEGRVGGNGARFNLGEVTVTRCALKLTVQQQHVTRVGVAWVLGRSARQAELAALADALLQDPAQHATVTASVLEPTRRWLQQQGDQRRQRAQTTKVEFFTVAREAGAGNEGAVDEP